MGKGHRDNHAARKKRGEQAFALKAKRRKPDHTRVKCSLCGTVARKKKAKSSNGSKTKQNLCNVCYEKYFMKEENHG